LATVCGVRHKANEDSAIELTDAGVFAIADGMGGHSDGALASQSIIEIIRRVGFINASLDAKVADIEAALHSVNAALRQEATSRSSDIIGSTVAVLVLDEHYAVCIWSGDSRIYLRRSGHLYQLTVDHSLHADENTLTQTGDLIHAVGSADVLVLDRIVTGIEVDDIFLVCSDGVTKTLPDEDLNALLAEVAEGSAERIVAKAVARGATDDVSAITVRCVGAVS
jgi:serine/threonine protein phosphatase PrpC